MSSPTPPLMVSSPQLPVHRYELTFKVSAPIVLPPVRGSVVRGVFGLALRRMSKGEEPVPDLPDEFACSSLYSYFFGELLPSTSARRTANRKAPRPYVIDLPPTPTPSLLAEGDLLAVGLCLIGRANLVLDAVVSAFDRGAAIGLGATRGHARLLQVAALWHADPGDDRIVCGRVTASSHRPRGLRHHRLARGQSACRFEHRFVSRWTSGSYGPKTSRPVCS